MTSHAMPVTGAPGKLFLSGEYAVLEGAPAILRAMPQRARVSIRPADSGELRLMSDATRVQPLSEALGNTPIVDSVMASLSAQDFSNDLVNRVSAGRLSMLLDTSAFYRNHQKLGLGSSAALTVALVRALTGLEQPEEEALIRLATDAHQRLQGGLGSGADIALSALDRDIIFRRHQAPVAVTLPPDLRLLYIWTGMPASSAAYLKQLDDWRLLSPSAYQPIIKDLSTSAEQAVQRLCENDAAGLISALGDYDKQLEQLSKLSRLDFYNQAHIRLRKQVESADCIYKLSGAGGGDFGIALSSNREHINQLAKHLTQQGIFHFSS